MPSLRVLTYPTVEPVTVAEALVHLRLEEDDSYVAALLAAAREWAEHFTGLALAATGYEYRLDAFADSMVLPVSPVQSVSEILYLDADEAELVLDPGVYEVDVDPWLATVRLATGQSWPTIAAKTGAVRLRFVSGYSAPGESPQIYPVPASVKHAILLLVGHWYEHREEVSEIRVEQLPVAAKSLLRPYRVRLGMA